MKKSMIISHLTLRKIIGWIGCLLPLAVVLGSYCNGYTPLKHTVSAYYHSNAGDLFVGGLIVCGLFLISYRGHDFRDDLIGNIAGILIILTALFATFPRLGEERKYVLQFINPEVVGIIHGICAIGTFIFLGIMSSFQFSQTDNDKMRKVYIGLGISIFLSLALIGIVHMIPNRNFLKYDLKLVFWFETIILVSFGISWLLKGKFLANRVT